MSPRCVRTERSKKGLTFAFSLFRFFASLSFPKTVNCGSRGESWSMTPVASESPFSSLSQRSFLPLSFFTSSHVNTFGPLILCPENLELSLGLPNKPERRVRTLEPTQPSRSLHLYPCTVMEAQHLPLLDSVAFYSTRMVIIVVLCSTQYISILHCH